LCADEADGDRGSQVAQVLPEHDRGRRRRDRRELELLAAHCQLDALQPAVAQSALRERSDRALACRNVDLDLGALTRDRHTLGPELLGGRVRELERVRAREHGVVAPCLELRAEGELVDQLGELGRSRVDHLEVAHGRLVVALHPDERLGEPVHGRKRRAQVVAREHDELGELRVFGQRVPW
jgi:hypothetical protein